MDNSLQGELRHHGETVAQTAGRTVPDTGLTLGWGHTDVSGHSALGSCTPGLRPLNTLLSHSTPHTIRMNTGNSK